jgi:SAM-dependent methyltransferase
VKSESKVIGHGSVALSSDHQGMSEHFEWTPDFWQGWRENENPYRRYKSQRDRELALQCLALHDGESVLEVGCGYGWVSQTMWETAQIKWHGIDRSARMIRHLRGIPGGNAQRSILGDATRLPFSNCRFDKILCTGVLMHIKEDHAALGELVRVLRPGGRLLCSVNNLLSPYALPVMAWNRRKRDFVQKFRAPFKFASHMRNLGLRSIQSFGDGIIGTVNFSFGSLQVPPRLAFPIIRRVDQWSVKYFPWLAYEIWFVGVKPAGS